MVIKRNKIIIIVTVCLLLFSVTAGALAAVLPRQEKEKTSTETESVSATVKEGRFNILLAGTDRASGLTDVIMLVSIDRDTSSASVLQIPRDTYAAYTDKSYKKLNGAYGALGGGGALRNLLSGALGLRIDRYAVLSPDALKDAVDALGGVEIELQEPLYYKDPYQGFTVSLPKGKQNLDGAEAEQFIRYRSGYANGDIGRIDAQKVFMTALLKKVGTNLSPIAVAKLAASLLGKIDTDITMADVGMLSRSLSSLSRDRVYFATAPGQAAEAKSGASYYAISKQATDELLVKYFGGRAGAFDKNNLFLNVNNQKFGEIYGGYSEYRVYTASQIAESGLGNASAP